MNVVHKRLRALILCLALTAYAAAQNSDSVRTGSEMTASTGSATIKDAGQRQPIILELNCEMMAFLGPVAHTEHLFPSPWSLGIGISYQAIPHMEFGGQFSYHHLTYDRSNDLMESNYPYYYVTSVQPDGAGKIFEASGSIRFFLFSSIAFQPCLFIQMGYFWTTFPGITYHSVQNGVPQAYHEAGSKTNAMFYGSGFGARLIINRSIALRAEINGKLRQGNVRRGISGALYLGLQFAAQYKF